MKQIALLVFLLSFTAQSQIRFESTGWNEALVKAKQENKLIFLDAYATWCQPCKVMEEYIFTDLEVGNFYNKNFINVRLDMEEYPGAELAERYSVSVYPSLLFVNGNGEIIHRGCGSMDSSEFLALGQVALSDDVNLSAYEQKYDAGERSAEFMMDYLSLLESVCLDAEGFASDFLGDLEPSELMESAGWAVLASYQWDIFSTEFDYLLQNMSAFEDAIGKEAVHAKLYDSYLSQYQEVYESQDLHDFGMRALMNAMKGVTFTGSDTLQVMMQLHYAEFVEDWVSFATNAIEFVGMTNLEDPEELSELSWKFYLFVSDKNQLQIAASWAKQAVDKLPEPSLIDTYASLQYKLGNNKKAIELEKRALELAKELYEDIAHYEYQLSKFEGK